MVPATDPFSTFGQDRPWVAYSWLFEVLVYGLYERLDLSGIILYRAALGFAVAVAVHRFIARREPRFVVASGLTGLAFMTCACLMNERPWLFTILFFTLTLDSVLDLRAGRSGPSIWLLPISYRALGKPAYPVHLRAVHLGAGLCRPLHRSAPWPRPAGRTPIRSLARLVATRGPHGRLPCGDTSESLSRPAICRRRRVRDPTRRLSPGQRAPGHGLPRTGGLGRAGDGRLGYLRPGLATSAAGVRVPPARLIRLLLLSHQAQSLVRRAGVAGDRNGRGLPARLGDGQFPPTRRRSLAVAVGVVLVLAAIGWGRGLSPSRLAQAVEEKFPASAASFVAEQHLKGPLYNHFDWGGYPIWRLPQLPVAMDGRSRICTETSDSCGPARPGRASEAGTPIPSSGPPAS